MALKFPIFMDAQSTTPCDPRVVEAMLPYFTEKFGHPASRNHPFGWEAEGATDAARARVARLIGARDAKEVVFTSGGTEAINLALKGVDRKSTRLNSSHGYISYAVFCLKKKKTEIHHVRSFTT